MMHAKALHNSKGQPHTCPVCLTQDAFIWQCSYLHYSLYLCPNCDVMFWFPLEYPGINFYEEFLPALYGYYVEYKMLEWDHRQFLKDRPARGGRLLDVGCGQFLNAARSAGYEVTGIDPDRRAVETAIRRLGLECVYRATWEQFIARSKNEQYDVITAFQLIEHLTAPFRFVRCMRELLKDGGFLSLGVPNRQRFGGKRDDFDLPPNHFTRWNRRSIEQLLRRAGFRVITIRIQPATPMAAATGLGYMIRFGIGRKVIARAVNKSPEQQFRFLRKAAVLYRIKYTILAALIAPICPFLQLFNKRGDRIYALAQKI